MGFKQKLVIITGVFVIGIILGVLVLFSQVKEHSNNKEPVIYKHDKEFSSIKNVKNADVFKKKEVHDKKNVFISNTSISGRIYSNQTWSGTIRITGDIMAESSAITILPGTTVLVESGKGDMHTELKTIVTNCGFLAAFTNQENCPFDNPDFYKDIIEIRIGKLVAKGTKDKPIKFISTTQSSPYDWGSLSIDEGYFDYFELGYMIGGGVYKYLSANHSSFHTSIEPLLVIREGAAAVIDDSTFYSCGIECIFNRGNTTVTNSVFEPMKEKISPLQLGSNGFSNGGIVDQWDKFSYGYLVNDTFGYASAGYHCGDYSSNATIINSTFIKYDEKMTGISLGEDIGETPYNQGPTGQSKSGKYRCYVTIIGNSFIGFSSDPGKARPFRIFQLADGEIAGRDNYIENYNKYNSKESFFLIQNSESELDKVRFNPKEVVK